MPTIRLNLLLCFPLLFDLPCAAQSRQAAVTLSGLSRDFEDMVGRVNPSVVQIFARGINDRSGGSGVVVDSAGYIVTNAHVVGVSRRLQVVVPVSARVAASSHSVIKPVGRRLPARLVGIDRETDLAVLKIDAGELQAIPFGDSERIRMGQLVFAFGSPFGLQNSVSMGVVSSPARQVQPDGAMIYIQTDASINPGNSGGPLVDSSGTLIGINTFIVSSSGSSAGVGFAAPSNIVRTVYEQIRKDGSVRRGDIGVKVQTISTDLATAMGLKETAGVLVADVRPSSSAAAGGLEIRDVLLSLNGKPLENARQFEVNIYSKAGETVTLELVRGAEKITRQVAVLEREPDRQQLLSRLEGHSVPRLASFVVELDEKITPLLPNLRRLSGVVVVGVTSEGNGFDDALQSGDVIYEINGTKIASVKELESAIASSGAGSSVVLQVERSRELQFLLIELQ